MGPVSESPGIPREGAGDIPKNGDVKDEATLVNNIGGIYGLWGRYPKALEYYERSLAIRTKLGDRGGEGTSLSNLGGIYRTLGQYRKSAGYLPGSLAVFKKAAMFTVKRTCLTSSRLDFRITW